MSYFMELAKGIVIGAAMIIPGVSGGVLAVIMGIYDKLLKAVSNLFKDFKKNFLYLLPIGTGIILGILIFSKILKYMFDKYPMPIRFAFMGFIIGSIPILFRHIKKKHGKFNYSACGIAFAFAICLAILDKISFFGTIQTDNIADVSTIRLLITGMLVAIGTIVPGVSNFQLLLLIGTYTPFLSAIAAFTNPFGLEANVIINIAIMMVGFIIGSILLIKLLSHLIEKYYTISYSAISGFTIGSILIIYPGLTFSSEGLISILLLMIGIYVSTKLSMLEKE